VTALSLLLLTGSLLGAAGAFAATVGWLSLGSVPPEAGSVPPEAGSVPPRDGAAPDAAAGARRMR